MIGMTDHSPAQSPSVEMEVVDDVHKGESNELVNSRAEEEDYEAVFEHNPKRESFLLPLDEIEQRFGKGTRLYFNFLKYIILCNVINLVLGLINTAFFAASDDAGRTVMCNYPNLNFTWRNGCKEGEPVLRRLTLYEKLFVGSWTTDQRTSWFGLSVATFVLWYLYGPIYALVIGRAQKSKQMGVDAVDDENDRLYVETDRIKENEGYSTTNRVLRQIATTALSVTMIVAGVLINYHVQLVANRDDISSNTIYSFAMSAVVAIINTIWTSSVSFIVDFEHHRTWSGARQNYLVKLYLFKIVNVTANYAALNYAFADPYSCPMQQTGAKFITLIILDLFVFNALEFLVPPLKLWLYRRCGYRPCLKSHAGDDALRPEFDVAQELIELLYRQFVLYTGTITMPLLAFLGLITNIVEYPLDKARLLYFCRPPKRLEKTMTNLIVTAMVCSALAATLTYPFGAMWVIFGVGETDIHEHCSLWVTKASDIP